jgi:hypothetical protein
MKIILHDDSDGDAEALLRAALYAIAFTGHSWKIMGVRVDGKFYGVTKNAKSVSVRKSS